MADVERFLRLTAEDHERARATPYVAALIDWVEHEQNQGIQATLYAVRGKQFEDAFYCLAKADALGDLVNRIMDPPKPAEPIESNDDPDDPAMPESQRGK